MVLVEEPRKYYLGGGEVKADLPSGYKEVPIDTVEGLKEAVLSLFTVLEEDFLEGSIEEGSEERKFYHINFTPPTLLGDGGFGFTLQRKKGFHRLELVDFVGDTEIYPYTKENSIVGIAKD